MAALRRLPGCDVVPAANRDLVVLVTDTPDEATEEALGAALAGVPALQGLALVAGVGDEAVADTTIHKLALVATVAAQVGIVMLVSELFTEFYRTTHHSESAVYLYAGLEGRRDLVPWSWTSVALTLIAAAMLSVHRLRRTPFFLYLACALLFVGVLIEKSIGTIIPGFVPEPWGKIPRYLPTWIEITVAAGLWALGAFVFTVLAKAAIPIELGHLASRPRAGEGSTPY